MPNFGMDDPSGIAGPTSAPTPAAAPVEPRRHGHPRPPSGLSLALGAGVFSFAAIVVTRTVDTAALRTSAHAMADRPLTVALAVAVFASAFLFRAAAWHRVLPDLGFGQALAGIHLAFGANHVLPLRLGEPLRIVSVVRRARIPLDAATSSTVALRAADIVAIVTLGWLVGPAVVADLLGAWAWAVLATVGLLGAVGLVWLRSAARNGRSPIRLPGPSVALLTVAAWLAESVLTWQASHWAGLHLSYAQAVVVTAVAVGAQIAAIAPSGFGTYEAAAVAAYVALGYDGAAGLAAALTVHALTTAYSLVVGAVAVFSPSPGLLGRFRLPASLPAAPTTASPPARAGARVDVDAGVRPIVLFLPARDEERTVASVIRRTPAEVGGHPVLCLVIDDGSLDATVSRAVEAGASVVSLGRHRGLGAAVRRGFEEATRRRAVAVAFCDADEEYDPTELGRLVAPILGGEADYVVGSRFAGGPRRMRAHRSLGNRVLTRGVAFVTRRRVTDGQSGFRALSGEAAAAAEVIHDFNYAQVLTLDLLAKGFRYAEVPISYRFRTEGRSFVRLGPYLRNVVPAVYAQLNARGVRVGSPAA